MTINIDKNSGFCFGVEFAIQIAEDEIEESGILYCLGDIVHNDVEVSRLHAKGLRIIDRGDLINLKNSKVLIRAHGEPPETYKIALENNLELIDASCPVVLKLQNRIKSAFDEIKEEDGQIVIYGKEGHAEVIGLNGQTKSNAIIISSEEDLDKVDFKRPVTLFSQTTKSTKGFYDLKEKIARRIEEVNGENASLYFKANDSICRQVSNREPQLVKFSQEHDAIIFVSGRKSSNGKALFEVCRGNNDRSYFVESEKEVKADWFKDNDRVGVCGATSTPMWLMEQVAHQIEAIGKIK